MTTKDLKLTDLEQDTQIEANRVNINEQIVLTNTNTTDIAEIKEYLDYSGPEGRPATTDDIENLQGQIDTNDTELADHETRIEVLETNDASQDGRLTALETGLSENDAIDTQQDQRLEVIENALAVQTSDYAIFAVDGTIDETGFTLINEVVVKDFTEDGGVAAFNPDTGLVTVFKDATVTNNFHFTASQLTGTNVVVTVSLVNITKGTTVDTANIELDFSGSITLDSGTRFNKGDVEAGDELDVVVKTDAGNSVTIVSSALDYEVAVKQGQLDSVFDYNVVSTSSMGNASTLLDINQLATEMDAAEARLDATEAATATNTSNIATNTSNIASNDTDIADLQGRVDALEGDTATSDLEERVEANEGAIIDLQTDLDGKVDKVRTGTLSALGDIEVEEKIGAVGIQTDGIQPLGMKLPSTEAGTQEAQFNIKAIDNGDGTYSSVFRFGSPSGRVSYLVANDDDLTNKEYVDDNFVHSNIVGSATSRASGIARYAGGQILIGTGETGLTEMTTFDDMYTGIGTQGADAQYLNLKQGGVFKGGVVGENDLSAMRTSLHTELMQEINNLKAEIKQLKEAK